MRMCVFVLGRVSRDRCCCVVGVFQGVCRLMDGQGQGLRLDGGGWFCVVFCYG